jgi:hypothetical protein
MQAYKKAYLKSRNLTEYDFIPCELCWAEAVDIHHIPLKKKLSVLIEA